VLVHAVVLHPVVIRPAVVDDGPVVAEVWLRSFDAALPTVRRAHRDDEVRAWVRDVLIPGNDTWVAEVDGAVVGVLALSDGWIEQLYLRPDVRGRGIGDRFMTLAKERRPAGLQLWTFQVNGPARRFYERHGFVAVEHTDGAGNEEREPDVRYLWRPADAGPGSHPVHPADDEGHGQR
jgi:GNAT superfamily N-acetyltransferase